MKKGFIAACLVILTAPLVGTVIHPTRQAVENLVSFPRFYEQGEINDNYLADLGTYFEQHVIFRNECLYLDAMTQKTLFHVSSVPDVILGSDDWLYYRDTLDDFCGENQLSEDERCALAHNLEVVQKYLENQGIAFVFTIAPNKNTLYPQHMPEPLKSLGGIHGAELLKDDLKHVNYVDCFELFKNQENELYLHRDSHWNNAGAALVYEAIMKQLGMAYTKPEPTGNTESVNGDLNRMLYNFYGKTEENPVYENSYEITNQARSVEDGLIMTSSAGTGRLLMFRDSFGNSLLPFFAGRFAAGCFSKGEPYALRQYVEEEAPDVVIMEKVERNIADLLTSPPLITMPEAESVAYQDSGQTLSVIISEDENICELSGTVSAKEVFLEADGHLYEVYLGPDHTWRAYLDKADFASLKLIADGNGYDLTCDKLS